MVVIVNNKSKAAKFSERVSNRSLSTIDIGLSVAHFTLAATELELSTCIIGIMDEEKLKEELGLDNSTVIEVIVALGYAKSGDPIRSKERKPLNDILEII